MATSTAKKKPAKRRRQRSPQVMKRVETIGPGGPPAGVGMSSNKRRLESHPLIGAHIGRLDVALKSAFRGRPASLMDLYDDMRDRDLRVDPVCRTRTSVIQGRSYTVKPPAGLEDDAEAKEIARRVTVLLGHIKTTEGGGWRSVIGQAADGILRGYAPFELEWAISRDGWHYPAKMHWRHPNRFIWSESFELRKHDMSDPFDGVPLDTWGPDKFAVHSPMAGRAAYPTRRGVMLGMIFPSLAKRYGLRWWLKATEKWGSPLPWIDLPDGSEEKASALTDAFRKQMADWVLVTWGGMKVQALDGTGQLRPEVFTELVSHSDVAIAIGGLGQNLTTEVQGGSFAAAKVSNLIRLDLLSGDLAELDDWVMAQIIERIVRYNWPGAPVPRYVTEIGERGEPTAEDVRDGTCSPDERRAALGFPAKPDGTGDEFREPQSLQTVQTQSTGPRFIAEPSGGTADDDPFGLGRAPRTSTSTLSSPTFVPSMNGPERALYESLVGLGRSPSKPS